jgi:mono/diheme cytochrome c family protein
MTRSAVLTIFVCVGMAGSLLHAEQGAGAAPTAAAVAHGEKVFAAQKCSICHAVAGKGNKNGALDGVGTKLSAADIRAWIVTPVEMSKKHNSTRKPPMKSFAALPQADIDALVAYLQSLKK